MAGPTLGGSLGGSSSSSNTLNIRALGEVSQVQPGDFLLIEVPAGTRIVDYKNFMIGKANITFANELTALRGDVNTSITLSNTLSSVVLDGSSTLFVKSLSALNPLTGHSGIRLGKTGMIQNNGGMYTFNVPVSTTFTFHDSGGNSNQWNAAFSVTNAGSAKWWSAYTSLTAESACWKSTCLTTKAKSGNWDSAYTTVYAKSATWGGGSSKWTDGGDVTYLTSTGDRLAIGAIRGAEKLSVYGNISASQEVYAGPSHSIQWGSTYNTVYANSAAWSGGAAVFKTIGTTGQTSIVADSSTDTLTLSAMGSLEIHHHAGSDRIILSGGSGGGGGSTDAFKIVATSGEDNIVADSSTDTLNLSAMGNFEIQHHAGTDTVILSGGAGGGGGGGTPRTDFEIMMTAEVFR